MLRVHACNNLLATTAMDVSKTDAENGETAGDDIALGLSNMPSPTCELRVSSCLSHVLAACDTLPCVCTDVPVNVVVIPTYK